MAADNAGGRGRGRPPVRGWGGSRGRKLNSKEREPNSLVTFREESEMEDRSSAADLENEGVNRGKGIPQSDIATPIEPLVESVVATSSIEPSSSLNPKRGEEVGEAAANSKPAPNPNPGTKKSWAAITRGNRDPARGMELKFVPPSGWNG